MTPATDSIMGTLPPERASVGSAINDTVRQVGGALGVAVLGSVLSSHYRDGMDGAARACPASAGHAAQTRSPARAPSPTASAAPPGQALHHAANAAFVDGMQVAILVAAAVTAAGALIALAAPPLAPRHRRARPRPAPPHARAGREPAAA